MQKRYKKYTDLLETTLDEVVTGNPDVLRRRETLERYLVLVGLLELLPVDDLVDDALLALNDDVGTLLHLSSLLLGDDAIGLLHLLEILSGLVTPEHVLEGSLVEMVIDVVESVLGDVTDDQVRMLPGLTAPVGLQVTDEELDESRLSGTVRSEDGNTGRQGDLKGDVVELLDIRCGVLEANLAPSVTVNICMGLPSKINLHLHEGLLLGLDTLKERGVGELELVVLSGLERVVRLGLRHLLDELLKVTAIPAELEAVQVEYVGDGVVEETRVVRNDDYALE